VECYRGKRIDWMGLNADPSLNLPQGGEIDNRLRINQPQSQICWMTLNEIN
jgi:hypothetical protein